MFLLTIPLFLACNESSKFQMINLADIDGVFLEIRYATTNNFTGKQIYKSPQAWMIKPAGEAIKKIVRDLQSQGYSIKIYDAYRPLSAQRKLWEIYPDPTFVANPQNGSRHNRGAAIDLTLTDLKGNEISMPTGYDDFTERASHSYMDLPDSLIANRKRLKQIMEKYGFESLDSEWWHYDYKGWSEFPLLDIDFDEIITQ